MPTLEEKKTELLVLREAYRRVFRTEDGKAVLADLVERCERKRSLRPAEGAPMDPFQAVWNEGVREPIRWITSMIKETPDE